MQPWNNTWLLVIQLLLFFHGAEEYSTNLCPGAKGCRWDAFQIVSFSPRIFKNV